MILMLAASGAAAPITRADIFEWESKYLGSVTPSTTPCPDGAGVSPAPYVDLSGRNLTKAYLAGFDMTGANFVNANLGTAYVENSTLSFANFSGANLSNLYHWTGRVWNANLTSANLSSAVLYADFTGSDFTNANFSGAKISGAYFNNATITGANFHDADWGLYGFTSRLSQTANWAVMHDLHGIALGSINLNFTNFSGFNLAGTDLSQTIVSNATFTGANITGANFSGTGLGTAQLYSTSSYIAKNLGAINLSKKTLSSWNFASQSMQGADLSSATIIGSSFWRANLVGANFTSAAVSGTTFAGADLAGADFRSAVFSRRGSDNLGDNDLTEVNLIGADFTGAVVSNVRFGASISRAQFLSTASYQQKRLTGVGLASIDLSGTDLSGGELSGSWFEHSVLSDVSFNNAKLESIAFWYTALDRADFSDAPKVSGRFDGCSLAGATFAGATVAASFYRSDLTADFRGANLTSSNLDVSNVTNGADFTDATIGGAWIGVGATSGMTASQFYSTASYKRHDLGKMTFDGDASGWDFSGQDLRGTRFGTNPGEALAVTKLIGANFADALVTDVSFLDQHDFGLTASQLRTTASYKNHALRGIVIGDVESGTVKNFSGIDLSWQDLRESGWNSVDFSDASFRGACLTGS
jgi:uncharacterized protein YjbI with pentapeptide repeats